VKERREKRVLAVPKASSLSLFLTLSFSFYSECIPKKREERGFLLPASVPASFLLNGILFALPLPLPLLGFFSGFAL